MDYEALAARKGSHVLFETDFCCDVDDVGALSVLVDAHKKGVIALDGVIANVNAPYVARALEKELDFLGAPDIPVAMYDGENGKYGSKTPYADKVSELLENERPYQTALGFYRDFFKKVPDQSVSIVSTGFFNSLCDALFDDPDLFNRKVRTVVAMAGSFRYTENYREFNVIGFTDRTRKFVENYGGELIFSGFEAGVNVVTDLTKCRPDPENPVWLAYFYHTKGKLTRPSWDPVTADFAISGENEFYGLSACGVIGIREDGSCSFDKKEGGKHRYVYFKKTDEEVGKRITDLIVSAAGL